ncbi:hypothetical protein HaLaN_15748, partial [Haematococcus lacustris]
MCMVEAVGAQGLVSPTLASTLSLAVQAAAAVAMAVAIVMAGSSSCAVTTGIRRATVATTLAPAPARPGGTSSPARSASAAEALRHQLGSWVHIAL